MFKQGDWVSYKDHSEPYIVERVVGYNLYIYLHTSKERYEYGWHDPRSLFGNNPKTMQIDTIKPFTLRVLDRDCVLIPQEVVDIIRSV